MITFQSNPISPKDESISIWRDNIVIGKIYPPSENIKALIQIHNHALTIDEFNEIVYKIGRIMWY